MLGDTILTYEYDVVGKAGICECQDTGEIQAKNAIEAYKKVLPKCLNKFRHDWGIDPQQINITLKLKK